jgi:eukaryotic-like serine/threonine-protein kinase
MSLSPGTRLGPYEILGALGAGGMGEVYKARDTRLDRTVAIKVLPPLTHADPDVRARFEREARLLASFDHPHICALHDIGRHGDIDYLVMPHLTGETLKARLAKGVLPLSQVMETATQISDALDRAHGHGIIHRDLKPANIMLTRSGARLLDFGLARMEEPPASGNQDDIATRSVLTKAGKVMGTLPYMSPEHLHGKQVDSRTDIWAFGCVLYEMLAGRPPFAGESDAAVMGAILRSEPEPLSNVRPDVPAVLDEIVSGALAKDPEERWQSMRDVKRALAIAGRIGYAAVATASTSSRQRGVVVPLRSARDARLGTSDVFVNELDRDLTRPLTSDRGTENDPTWSPDSQTIVFAADRHGPPSLYVRNADGTGEEREVVPPASGPLSAGSFTPDGRSLVFLQPNPGTDDDIMLAPMDGRAAPVPIVKTKGREASPRLSLDGRWLAYTSNESGRAEVYVQAWPDGHGRRQVSRDGGVMVRWRGDGRELYFISGPGRDHVMAASLGTTGDSIASATPQLLFVARADVQAYDVTKDGKTFLVISSDRVADRGTLSVAANWARLLRK